MKTIELSRGAVTMVDDVDFEMLSADKWHLWQTKARPTRYATRKDWDGKKNNTRWMHRVILDAPKGMEVDHIDGDGLNNQRSNLRLCSRSQNARNSGPKGGRKWKGVTRDAHSQLWGSVICCKNKQIHIGRYFTELRAALAYDAMARRLHGDFARLNFPHLPARDDLLLRDDARRLPRRGNKVGMRNVSLHKHSGLWMVTARRGGKSIIRKYFQFQENALAVAKALHDGKNFMLLAKRLRASEPPRRRPTRT